MRPAPLFRLLLCVTTALLALTATSQAQSDTQTPAFSVATSHVFNTKERPSLSLTYRRVDHLDFRVYRVNDAFAFFEKLRDPHQLGSEEPVVSQERTWLERIAAWKATRRSEVRGFLRRQLSPEYRTVRHEQQDTAVVVLRQTLNVNSFAQVPVLNASQLVTSWREILPPVRDAEFRRIPLELSSPGIYVVEAINPPLRAYTVVVISDVGLVAKTAPGRLLVYAANRFTGDPMPGCRVRVLADQQTVASGKELHGEQVVFVTLGEHVVGQNIILPGANSSRLPSTAVPHARRLISRRGEDLVGGWASLDCRIRGAAVRADASNHTHCSEPSTAKESE